MTTRTALCAVMAAASAAATAQSAFEYLDDMPWIGDGRSAPTNDAAYYEVRPAPEFRSRFVCPKGMANTVLRIAAAGYYRLSVNGVPPDESAGVSLMPFWSPYGKTIYSDEYPLAVRRVEDAPPWQTSLRPWPETNEVSVVLGNGFYNLPPMRFLEKVFDYVCELFPSEVIHIGGDECFRRNWKKCQKCQAFMKREGLKGVEQIQPWVTRHFTEYLAKKGRRLIGWDQIFIESAKRDFAEFSARAAEYRRRLIGAHVNCAPLK